MSTQGSQGGGHRLGQGFWAGLGQVQWPFVQVKRSLQLVGAWGRSMGLWNHRGGGGEVLGGLLHTQVRAPEILPI